ncbi:MAG: DUF2877 domain-containing protein [Candidatus Eisenbacteria bacterium]|nr:DUF2877 domain-containing protein [Candidatus Eisenbacteria bacterium]
MRNAIRAGPLAAGAFAHPGRGRVASVHRSAINLKLEHGPYVALLPDDAPLHPWAVCASLDPARFTVGMEFTLEEGVLQAGTTRLHLAGAAVEALRIEIRPALAPAPFLLPGGGSPEAHGPFGDALRRGLRRYVDGDGARELAALVGLGVGLTPSGDDALVGVLAGLDLLGAALVAAGADRAGLVEELRTTLEPGRGTPRTHPLSAQMLLAAAAGLYPEPLCRMAEALAAAAGSAPGGGVASAVDSAPSGFAASAVDSAATALCNLGHTSGRDMLAGLDAALRRFAPGAGGSAGPRQEDPPASAPAGPRQEDPPASGPAGP